jgi:hypothetical protein
MSLPWHWWNTKVEDDYERRQCWNILTRQFDSTLSNLLSQIKCGEKGANKEYEDFIFDNSDDENEANEELYYKDNEGEEY